MLTVTESLIKMINVHKLKVQKKTVVVHGQIQMVTVLDKDDRCPDVKGTVANNGCPEISEEQIMKLNAYAKTILFNSGKATFQQQTYPVLQSIVAILKEYPSSKFSIEGHTDSDGKDAMNQKLSEERAAAVKNYLIENGISSDRLTSAGFGETRPIDSNKTKKVKLITDV
jgi:outer membrane protein OmpA-like peptidoglycan-associated protein